MGKDRDIKTLIRLLANTVVHQIVAEHTNKPESKHFLSSEVIEYSNQTNNMAQEHNWNEEDKKYIEEKALKMIKDKLSFKYTDINYQEHEAIKKLKEIINNLL